MSDLPLGWWLNRTACTLAEADRIAAGTTQEVTRLAALRLYCEYKDYHRVMTVMIISRLSSLPLPVQQQVDGSVSVLVF